MSDGERLHISQDVIDSFSQRQRSLALSAEGFGTTSAREAQMCAMVGMFLDIAGFGQEAEEIVQGARQNAQQLGDWQGEWFYGQQS